jgi:hypothetical protein
LYRYTLSEIVPAVQRACAEAVRSDPTIRLQRYRENPNPQAGLCYTASEAVFHLGGRVAGFFPLNIQWEDTSHWCLVNEYGTVCDPTVSQFILVPHYKRGTRRGFQTGYERPSKAAIVLMNIALRDLHTYTLPADDGLPVIGWPR